MKHVEAVIKLFDLDYNGRRIAVRRRYKGNPWFRRGTLFQVLRKAKEPMTARQPAEHMLTAQSISGVSPKAVRDHHAALGELFVKCSGTLERYVGDGVMTAYNVLPRTWKAKRSGRRHAALGYEVDSTLK